MTDDSEQVFEFEVLWGSGETLLCGVHVFQVIVLEAVLVLWNRSYAR